MRPSLSREPPHSKSEATAVPETFSTNQRSFQNRAIFPALLSEIQKFTPSLQAR